jgi:hypothetical protein
MVTDRRAFGTELKQQRERRKITLQSISQDSKVPASLFEGLERGDCSRWPAAIYGRAYVRAYADAIGANPNHVVERFTALYHPAPPDEPGATPRAAESASLRISMDDAPAFEPGILARRAALAGADLVIGFLIATIAYVGLDLGAWTAIASVLAYHTVGRLVSDEPLLYWMYVRARTAGLPEPEQPDKVRPVGDAASTTA